MNYIGIDIGGTNLKAGLVDEDGRLLAVKTMKIREVSDPDALTDTLVALTRELAQEGGVPMEEIASVGAGVPGVVDIRTGSIVYTCNLPLRNIPLRKLFKRRLGLHLYVENDANCAALAEYYAGAGQGSKRFVTITLGTGIGAGIIHNGKIFHGGNVPYLFCIYGGNRNDVRRRDMVAHNDHRDNGGGAGRIFVRALGVPAAG